MQGSDFCLQFLGEFLERLGRFPRFTLLELELAQERYRLGGGTFLELLEAQSSMATAERDYLNARYRFHGAIWALEAAAGQRLRPQTSG